MCILGGILSAFSCPPDGAEAGSGVMRATSAKRISSLPDNLFNLSKGGPLKMAKVKLNLGRLAVRDKISQVQQIITSMTGNPLFTTPHPPLETITAALGELQQAE